MKVVRPVFQLYVLYMKIACELKAKRMVHSQRKNVYAHQMCLHTVCACLCVCVRASMYVCLYTCSKCQYMCMCPNWLHSV
jgi:hypothetical protein